MNDKVRIDDRGGPSYKLPARPWRSGAGFTLLELLIVVAILALVAGVVVMSLEGTQDQAAQQLGQSEILEIKKAILQFKQDTGWLPKQGPFGLTTDSELGILNPSVDSHWPPEAPADAAGRIAWFHSPANFWQLYENALQDRNRVLLHPLGEWNPPTARGWRGPYLTRQGEGLVDVGASLQMDGSVGPASNTILQAVYGIADPFTAAPEGPYFVWRSSLTSTPHKIWGRPYLLFDVHWSDPATLRDRARIVSMGKNGKYESNAATLGGDDDVVYLFK